MAGSEKGGTMEKASRESRVVRSFKEHPSIWTAGVCAAAVVTLFAGFGWRAVDAQIARLDARITSNEKAIADARTDINQRLARLEENMVQQFRQVNRQFQQVNQQFQQVGERIDQVNQRIDQINRRIDRVIEILLAKDSDSGKAKR